MSLVVVTPRDPSVSYDYVGTGPSLFRLLSPLPLTINGTLGIPKRLQLRYRELTLVKLKVKTEGVIE